MAEINPIQVQKYLKGVDYPAGRDTLVETARKENAPDDVVQLLSGLPDEDYDAPTAVVKAISKT